MVVSIEEITPTPTENSNSNTNNLGSRRFIVKIINHDDFTLVVDVVTSTVDDLRNWITDTKTIFAKYYDDYRLVVGIAVQWTPQKNSASTIQLCADKRVLIYRLSHAASNDTCPPELEAFLHDPHITFVGLWKDDFMCNQLRTSNPKLSFLGPNKMPILLRNYLFHWENGRYRSLVRETSREIVKMKLGVDLKYDNTENNNDWEGDQLSLKQVSVASVNAFISYKLGMHICAWYLNPHYRESILAILNSSVDDDSSSIG